MKNLILLFLLLLVENLKAGEINIVGRSDTNITVILNAMKQNDSLLVKSLLQDSVISIIVPHDSVIVVSNLYHETEYKIELLRDGKVIDQISVATLATEPDEQASAVAVKNVTENGMTFFVRRGNGAKIAVFLMPDGHTFEPEDGVVYPVQYPSDSLFKSGTKIFCILNDSCESNYPIRITGLSGATGYIVRAFEYNGKADKSNYILKQSLSNPRKVYTKISSPIAVPPENITSTGFTAIWEPCTGAETYLFDLAVDSKFKNPDSFFNSADVGGITSLDLKDLKANTYYYRVRAVGKSDVSRYSNTIKVILK